MRNLTIKRNKAGWGCLGKIKIYIEDPVNGDLKINGVLCRKLGALKNGEEKTFAISEAGAKIFAIGDTLSRNYCNDCYILPEGEEDVTLTGQVSMKLSLGGNVFIFDGNDTEEAVEHRNKNSKKAKKVLIIAAIVGFIAGFIIGIGLPAFPEDFTVDGMTVTLTDEFFEEEIGGGYNAFYVSEKTALIVMEEPFATFPRPDIKNYTCEEYAELILELNGINATVKTVDGLVTYEYDFADYQTTYEYHYVCFAYKTDDAFWLLQFYTMLEDADDLRDDIFEYAKSVTFEN
jgi:hypothetical protein